MSDAFEQWAADKSFMLRVNDRDGCVGYVNVKEMALEAWQAALQSGEPVAVADRGVLNWIDGKQFAREADLYTTPQSHDWYPISRGFYHYLYKCKNCNAVAIDFPEEHIPILCGTTKV